MTKSVKNSRIVSAVSTVDKVIAKNKDLYRDWLHHRFPGYSVDEVDFQVAVRKTEGVERILIPKKG